MSSIECDMCMGQDECDEDCECDSCLELKAEAHYEGLMECYDY